MPTKRQLEKYRAAIIAVAAQDGFACVYGSAKKQRPAETTGWTQALCPLHAERHPSFGWHRTEGNFKCFGCGETGSPFDFIALTSGGNWQDAMLELGDRLGVPRPAESTRGASSSAAPTQDNRPQIPEDLVTDWQRNLWSTDPAVRWLREKRGLTDATLKRFEIGLEPKGAHPRNTIPIRDPDGRLVNVRRYNAKRKKDKMISYVDGKHKYGSPARLFGAHRLTPLKDGARVGICITEGEWDCLMLWQEGLEAVTTTNGAGSYARALPGWLPIFKGRDVAIILDCDPAGKKAAQQIVDGLAMAGCASVRCVLLPLSGTPDSKDVTDYLHKEQHSSADLRALIRATPPHVYATPAAPAPPEEIIELASFTEIERKELAGKKVRCKITVIGETSESFHAVGEFRVKRCPKMDRGGCNACLGALEPATVPHGSREYIGSCMAPDRAVQRMIADFACVNGQSLRIEVLKRETVKEFFCTQFAQRVTHTVNDKGEDITTVNGKREEALEKKVYLLSHLRPTVGSYQAEGWILPHPQTQQITMLIDKLEPVEDYYESFRVADNLDDLRRFKALKLGAVLADLETNVTRIYQRQDLLMACLLNLCCPLWLNFNGERIRGWLNVAIVGDSGQGKSATIERLCAWMNVGDRFSGLTGSRTGLVYALAEHKQRGWQLKIGRYPANDGKFIAVDEAQALDEQDIRTMSTAMDTGELQVDRVQSGHYPSRTRVMFIANPKGDRVMDSFTMGCKALPSLYPAPVIRRLDFALAVTMGDISDSRFINQDRVVASADAQPAADAKITAAMLRAVVYLAWTLPQDKITFTADARTSVLQEATLISDAFGNAPDVPLAIRSDFRNKLARIAAAFAMIDLALDATFTTLTVDASHVERAERYISRIYSADNFQLDRHSDIQHKASVLDYDALCSDVIERVDTTDGGAMFAKVLAALWGAEYINRKDMAELVGATTQESLAGDLRFLKERNLLNTTKSGSYNKTPKFNRFLRRFVAENPEYIATGGGSTGGTGGSGGAPDGDGGQGEMGI